ncbi:MAG: adenylate/guanylate cyclase domain-containing protein, partial [Actinomycetota bacterium]
MSDDMGGMREERRVVTALFVDIVGSTPLGERLDPEDLKLIVADAIARIIGAVEAFGGTVKDLAGDGVLALFGAPISHEDDAERAIRVALAACEQGDVRRAAVASGEALVAGADRAATGQVVTRARALLVSAPTGRVAVATETAHAAGRGVEFEVSGDVTLVAGLRTHPGGAGASAPMVGRTRELAALEQLFGTVVDRASAQA